MAHGRRRRRVSRWVVSQRAANALDVERPSDVAVERAVRYLSLLAATLGNMLGALAVFVLLVWVLPTRDLDTDGDGAPFGLNADVLNLILAGIYVLFAIVVGSWLGMRRTRPGRIWLREGRSPTEAEQRRLLRAPLVIMRIVGGLWLAAALIFGVVNWLSYEFELGQRIAVTVALGGLVTGAFAYMFTERLLRPAAARALEARPLEKPALPGLTTRAMIAWAIGAGIPIFGLLMIAMSALVEGDLNRDELAIAVLAIGGGALCVGFFAVLFAARASSVPVVSVQEGIREIEKGDFDAEVPVYDGTEVGMLQAGFNRMAEGLRERERIRELFGMHVGEDVARSALENEAELGGEQREVGVLFVDLVGSTAIAAERPPQEVVELLNSFFGIVVEVIDGAGGWVNKFEGDAALAIFGAPEPLDDAAGSALAAGRRLARRLSHEMQEANAGIGISYGTVVAGNIGGNKRFEYTVIGDPVNEAARLTELAKEKPNRIVASGAALEAAARVEARHWKVDGEVELRGRKATTRLALPRMEGQAEEVRDRPA
jgi:adenylate cyclase